MDLYATTPQTTPPKPICHSNPHTQGGGGSGINCGGGLDCGGGLGGGDNLGRGDDLGGGSGFGSGLVETYLELPREQAPRLAENERAKKQGKAPCVIFELPQVILDFGKNSITVSFVFRASTSQVTHHFGQLRFELFDSRVVGDQLPKTDQEKGAIVIMSGI